MQLNSLVKITTKGRRRLGQGHGSGRVKTAGRGTKGQKSRNKVPLFFEGGAVSLIKRLPFQRGKGRNKSFKSKPFVLNVSRLNRFPKNTVITVDALVEKNLVDKKAKMYGVKILGNGDITVPLTVQIPTSKKAAEKIAQAQGKVM